MNPHPIPRLRRVDASAYLRDNHGIVRSPATLAKLAVVGGGPRFQKVGRTPLYPVEELDRWAANLTGPLMTSTSDTAALSIRGAHHG